MLLEPFIDQLKEWRNDAIQQKYLKTIPSNYNTFIGSLKEKNNDNLLITVAFNVPELIDWNIENNQALFKNAQMLVFDNSSDFYKRKLLEEVCKKHQTPYFSLPKNPIKHPSRSHGISLSWIYENVVKEINPNYFGFIDHDIFLTAPTSFEELLQNKAFYGVLKESPWAWNLWAGFSFFNFYKVKDYPLNFLNDRPNGLDTGGRNYLALYQYFNKNEVRFATYIQRALKTKNNEISFNTDLIDNNWIHFRGAYTTNFKEKTLSKETLVKHSREIFEQEQSALQHAQRTL